MPDGGRFSDAVGGNINEKTLLPKLVPVSINYACERKPDENCAVAGGGSKGAPPRQLPLGP